MVIPMEFPTQADLMWFAICMIGIIVLTQLRDRYRKKQKRRDQPVTYRKESS